MALGDVYVWETDWHEDGQAFLFISSSDYGGDYLLLAADYPEFLTHDSYVSCSGLVFYTEGEVRKSGAKLVGKLSANHLAELRSAIANSLLMEGWQIRMVCGILDGMA